MPMQEFSTEVFPTHQYMTLNMFDLFLRKKDLESHKIVQQLHQVSYDFILIFVCDLKMP